MGRVFKPAYTKPDGRGGRVRVQVKNWYAEYTDEFGDQRRVKVGPDRRTAESALARLQESAARRKHGIPDPAAEAGARNRPLAELFAGYLEELSHRRRAPAYRAEVARHLAAVRAGCRWHVWSDVAAPALLKFLSGLLAGEDGAAPATANGYLRSAKGFCNWYAETLEARSPLARVKPFNEEVDRRRSRRVLSDPELERLIAAARAAPGRHNTVIDGPARAALYAVAAYTGLRASELASLTPEGFDLAASPPAVTVEARDAKDRRREPIPLHPQLAAFLKGWLRGKPARQPLWPGKWAAHRRQVKWVGRDARRAGLGDGVTFHGLKRKFVTGLIRSGADVDEVRRLARHKSVKTTLDHYAQSELPGLAKAVNRLPRLRDACATSANKTQQHHTRCSVPYTERRRLQKRGKPRSSEAFRRLPRG